MKILITGISGFVGNYLNLELTSRGHDVWGIDTSSNSEKTIAADLLNSSLLNSAVSDVSPDCVIHLAAIANVDHSNPSMIYDTNFNGTLNLLSSCSRLSSKPKFLFVSSSQIYGNVMENQLPIDETFPVNPVNHYGASKAAGEMIVKAFGSEYDFEYVIARPFNHTGTGQTDKFVIPKIVNAFKRGDKSIELGNINTIRDFTDVRDIVKGYSDIIENFKTGETYNIASGKGIKISGIFEMLKEITGQQMVIIQKDYLVRQNEIRSVIGSTDKILSDIGWKCRIELYDTLKNMFDSV